jgi:hypothetical protein
LIAISAIHLVAIAAMGSASSWARVSVLTADVGLALSLLQRGRDILIGIPALLVWHFIEGRRFWKGE